MDFRGRNSNQPAARPSTPAQAASAVSSSNADHSPFDGHGLEKLGKQPVGKLFKYASIVLLFAVTGLVITLTFLLALGGNSQMRAVKKDQYQAVFLNNGQVYFGNIKTIGTTSLDLQNIYYLQTSGSSTDTQSTATTASSNVSLIKLGCELHAPNDQMLINTEQIIFWENIQDSGQVAKAIADYKKQNASGCSTTSQSSTNQAPSTTPTATPTATPTPAATKKP